MTEIEKKALTLLNEGHSPYEYAPDDHPVRVLARAIEQHEAFRQEVSNAVESLCNTTFAYERYIDMRDMLRRRFVISKPDPLVEALASRGFSQLEIGRVEEALAAHGLKIVEDTDAPR